MKGTPLGCIGVVNDNQKFRLKGTLDTNIIDTDIHRMLHNYRGTFEGY